MADCILVKIKGMIYRRQLCGDQEAEIFRQIQWNYAALVLLVTTRNVMMPQNVRVVPAGVVHIIYVCLIRIGLKIQMMTIIGVNQIILQNAKYSATIVRHTMQLIA